MGRRLRVGVTSYVELGETEGETGDGSEHNPGPADQPAADRVNRAELEAQAGHEQFRLVAGLAFEGDGIVAGQLCAKTLADQADLRRTNAVD